MTTSFARTTHALQATDFRKAIIGLAIVSLSIICWLGWFLLAKITIVEISASIPIVMTETITAPFLYKAPGQLKRGQVARLKLDGAAGQSVGPIPALVTDIVEEVDNGTVQVTAFVFWELVPPLPPSEDALNAKMEIEVEHVSPATLLVRTVNDGLNTYPTRFTDPNRQSTTQNQ